MASRLALSIATVLLAIVAVVAQLDDCSVPVSGVQSEPRLCAGNFLLRLRPWYGRLGNNLVSIAHIVHFGRETKSEVLISPHPYFKQFEWDFRDQSKIDEEAKIERLGGGSLGRQIAITDDFYHPAEFPMLLSNWNFSTTRMRQVLVEDVLPAFRLTPKHVREAVVIHVRAGDVFTSEVLHPYYGQPPYAFYKSVLRLPELSKLEILVVAEDHANPVVGLMEKEFKKRVQVITDLEDGVATILGSRHLVLARSTFSENLAKMAPSVQALYFPYCLEEDGVDKRESKWDRTWNMQGYCFEYDDYIPVNNWTRSPEQMRMISELPTDKVHMFPLPVTTQQAGVFS